MLIITIGDTGTGGWWAAIDPDYFADGFDTQAAAEAAAIAAAGRAPWELWYRCEADGRTYSIPGAKSANHPEAAE